MARSVSSLSQAGPMVQTIFVFLISDSLSACCGLLFLLAEPAALLAVAALGLVSGGDVPGGLGHGVGVKVDAHFGRGVAHLIKELELGLERLEHFARERKAAAEAASKRVAGAFGKGSQMGGSKGSATSGEGVEGSKDGNSSTGAKSGVGGYGTFNLGGRSIGEGGLPRPVYNVQEEGRVVVSITVNPAGHAIPSSINRLTNTVNSTLRKAAEDAAKKARFNAVNGVNNQTGTITYYFNLK